MAKLIWLWIRQDGRPPSVLQRGSAAPGPGDVFEVEAGSRAEATRLVAIASTQAPDPHEDPDRWAFITKAQKRVRLLTEQEKTDG